MPEHNFIYNAPLPCSVTGIGSVPFRYPLKAAQDALASSPAFPYCPQTPQAGPEELMGVQVWSGYPHLKKPWTDLKFLESSEELDPFTLPKEAALPIPSSSWKAREAFLALLPERPSTPVKSQIAGPLVAALAATDWNGAKLADSGNGRAFAAAWVLERARVEIKLLKGKGHPIWFWVDDPFLGTEGWATDEVLAHANVVFKAIREEGAVPGLHSCNAADWGKLLSLDLEVLSFDASRYLNEFLSNGPAIARWIKGGRWIAWGLVPTVGWVGKGEGERQADRLLQRLENFGVLGLSIPAILERSLITPACGTSGLSRVDHWRIWRETHRAADVLKKRFSG